MQVPGFLSYLEGILAQLWKIGYSFLHLKSNDSFSNSQQFFFFSEKAKLGYIEMGPTLKESWSVSFPILYFK